MDITVESVADAVITALQNADYAESTIGQYRKSIKALRRFAEKCDGIYTKELGTEFTALTTSPATGRFSAQRRFDYGRLVWLFDSYVDRGIVDLSIRREIKENNFASQEYSQICVSWQAFMEQKCLASATREAYMRIACSYMAYLESIGVLTLYEAEGSTIYGYLESLMATWSRTSLYGILSNFRPFIKFTERHKLIDSVNNVKAARPHRAIPVLDKSDEGLLQQVCITKKRCYHIACPDHRNASLRYHRLANPRYRVAQQMHNDHTA